MLILGLELVDEDREDDDLLLHGESACIMDALERRVEDAEEYFFIAEDEEFLKLASEKYSNVPCHTFDEAYYNEIGDIIQEKSRVILLMKGKKSSATGARVARLISKLMDDGLYVDCIIARTHHEEYITLNDKSSHPDGSMEHVLHGIRVMTEHQASYFLEILEFKLKEFNVLYTWGFDILKKERDRLPPIKAMFKDQGVAVAIFETMDCEMVIITKEDWMNNPFRGQSANLIKKYDEKNAKTATIQDALKEYRETNNGAGEWFTL